ncbi:hypothetical protein [Chondromyces crocatus]|uniref:PilZ domain-containing protein n=1 Tax=Chondromyces crocatus TaxID=52 RepID=A0A0K1EM15_CHOCO|nr:hypothetical protein [Chondromyces crocatus]AKT41904.1 uncharacterized protein CMC5_061260 [Chondromyces crocatus]
MAQVNWTRGGEADLIKVDDDLVSVRSTRAAAPGTPLDGALTVGSQKPIRLKVARCKREESGSTFVIEGRLIDANREMRTELAGLARPVPPT